MNRNRNKYICVGMSKLAYILANMPLTNKKKQGLGEMVDFRAEKGNLEDL